jgi:H+/Cl- antiporter ClcA
MGVVLGAGVLGGGVGALYLGLLHLLQRVLWPTHSGLLAHGAILVAVGAAVAVLTRLLGNPGDVELLVDNIHVAGGVDDLPQLPSLLPISLLCIPAGGALGPEAPLVQTTGTLGSWLASRFGLDAIDRRVITITGMAAGFTVLFGTPLGAVMELFVGARTSLTLAAEVRAAIDQAIEYATNEMQRVLGTSPVTQLIPVDLIAELAAAAFLGIEVLAQNGRDIDLERIATTLAAGVRLLAPR